MPRIGQLASVAIVATALALVFGVEARAAVYNLRLLTENAPDYTDIDSFVASVTAHCKTPQEKCIAIWRWGRRSRRQTSCASEDGRLIWDPILHYNSYGAMNCGVISALNVSCFLRLGYQARYIQLGDHTVSEVSWDNGRTWHLFDSSMSFFCYNHQGQVASCQEIKEAHACDLSGGNSELGHYYLYHGAPQCRSHLGPGGWRCAADQPVVYERTLINGASSYTDGFSVDRYTLHARHGHRYILNLRTHESYTRYWRPLGKDNDYYRPLRGGDPDEQHGLHNLRGNGIWLFRPDLSAANCRSLLHDCAEIETRGESGSAPNVHPTRSGVSAFAVFKLSAANVITSMRIAADGWRWGPKDSLRILVSRDAGSQWTPVWQSQDLGRQQVGLSLRDEVAGVTECLVKTEMTAARGKTDVGLDTLEIQTFTQLNRRTLPKLTLGTNRVRLSAGPQIESTVLWPPLHAGLYRRTAYESRDVHSDEKPDGMYKATLGSAVDGRECFVTWRIKVPTDITSVDYGSVVTNRSSRSYVALQHSFDGKQFTEFFRKSDGDSPFDHQASHTLDGVAVPPGAREAYLKTAFFCERNSATYNMPGIQDVLVRVHHKPRDAGFQPIEVTYNWTEHRQAEDVTRSHTELIESLPHQYTINVAGRRDPTMNWVRINLQGHGPDGSRVVCGYSDGADVGADLRPKLVVYKWGKNLAEGKPYTASRPSSEAAGNRDDGGRELTNGVVVAPTDYATHRFVQPATALWASGDPVAFAIDLGRSGPVAGVRVCTHQPNARYSHSQQVKVAVSADGQTWHPAGTIHHDDLWQPPGDYEPWEHDDSPRLEQLPAGGRLAYSYPLAFKQPLTGRFVQFEFTPLPDRGMGISELMVFDHVDVAPASPPVAPFESRPMQSLD